MPEQLLTERGRTAGPSTIVATAIALLGGIGIALLDSSPGFDDTGISAVGLLAVAAVAAALDGRRPWLWAVAVGAWIPLLEIRPRERARPWQRWSSLRSGQPWAIWRREGSGPAEGPESRWRDTISET